MQETNNVNIPICIMADKNLERLSNFEILRILAMFGIIIAHFLARSGAYSQTSGWNYYFTIYAGGISNICVNLFVILGAFFLLDKHFSFKRIFNIYFQVLFCELFVFAILILNNISVPSGDIVKFIFPYTTVASSFAVSYINMVLLSPFLNKIINMPTKTLKLLILILILILIIPLSLRCNIQKEWFSNTIWFCILYLFTGYFKKHILDYIKVNKYYILLVGIFSYFLIMLMTSISTHSTRTFLTYQLYVAFTIITIFISFCIFYFFTRIQIGSIKWINFLASSAFSVYLISDAPVMRDIIWSRCFHVEQWLNAKYFILFAILTIIITYIFAAIIDIVRKIIWQIIIKNTRFIRLCSWLDKVFEEAIE